ncbi:MAG: hypothetical protein WA972_12765 [Rhodococcus qingshengii]
MTGEARAHAQARIFLTALRVEIEEVSAQIEKVRTSSDRALRAGHQVAQRRLAATEATLRKELYEAHRLIDRLLVRFPELRPADVAGKARPPRLQSPGRNGPIPSPNRTER